VSARKGAPGPPILAVVKDDVLTASGPVDLSVLYSRVLRRGLDELSLADVEQAVWGLVAAGQVRTVPVNRWTGPPLFDVEITDDLERSFAESMARRRRGERPW
jgi:hypothetical protein